MCDKLFDPYSENTHIKFASLTFLALIYRLECWIPKQRTRFDQSSPVQPVSEIQKSQKINEKKNIEEK